MAGTGEAAFPRRRECLWLRAVDEASKVAEEALRRAGLGGSCVRNEGGWMGMETEVGIGLSCSFERDEVIGKRGSVDRASKGTDNGSPVQLSEDAIMS